MKKEKNIRLVIINLMMIIIFGLGIIISKSSCYEYNSSEPILLGINSFGYQPFYKDVPIPLSNYQNLMKDEYRTGAGYSIGFSYIYPLNDNSLRSSLIFDLDYNHYNISFDKLIYTSTATVSDLPVADNVYYNEEYALSTLSLSGMYKYYPFDYNGFYISGGLKCAVVVHNNLTEKISSQYTYCESPDSTLNVKYENNGKTVIIYDDKPKSANSFIFSGKAEIGYDLIFHYFLINTSLGYDYNLNKVTSNSNWRLSNLYLGMRVIIAFY